MQDLARRKGRCRGGVKGVSVFVEMTVWSTSEKLERRARNFAGEETGRGMLVEAKPPELGIHRPSWIGAIVVSESSGIFRVCGCGGALDFAGTSPTFGIWGPKSKMGPSPAKLDRVAVAHFYKTRIHITISDGPQQ